MSSKDIGALFAGAQAAGTLGDDAVAAIEIEDLGARIQEGLGISPDDISASEVTIIALLIDDSGSIRFVSGNADAVRTGHNSILDALLATKQKDGVLVSCRYLNGEQLYPFSRLQDAVRMDARNYNPNGGTPLYDETIVVLGTAAAKQQEFVDNGVPCRVVTAVVTDGADMHSRKRAQDVAAVVSDLLKTESHIVIGVGIDDGSTDFKAVFKSMGIPEEWVLTPGNSPHEIRQAFATVSQSAVRASQNAGSFSKTAMGGFGS